MIEIIVGTNRKDSKSQVLAEIVKKRFDHAGQAAQILNFAEVDWSHLNTNLYGKENLPDSMKPLVEKVDRADGLYVICPEYNGSYPGVLKTFIDYWSYPDSFEKRPVCFMGIGGMFGGLRPVEHLQQVFGYRNAFIYPERIFLQNVWSVVSPEGEITDALINELLDGQTESFSRFIEALKGAGLHSNKEN